MEFKNSINRSKHLQGHRFLVGVLLLCFHVSGFFSQNTSAVSVSIKPVFAAQPFRLNDTTYHLQNGQQLVFETLKFYISEIQLFKNDSVVYTEQDSYHLYDASEPETQTIYLPIPPNSSFNTLAFNLGIDSTINVSGAMGADLDPTKGMYWAWQSGYINFKLEGKTDFSADPRKEFQFHIGGYQNGFNALRTVTIKIPQKKNMELLFDVSQFIEHTNLLKYHHIMSPGDEAVRLSSEAVKCFSVN